MTSEIQQIRHFRGPNCSAVLDQIAWLDELGFDLVWFTEHHFVDDGYLPSWIPVAGAVASRASRIRISSTSP